MDDRRVFFQRIRNIEFQKINNIHNGTALINVEQYDFNDLVFMKYAPITSVDVERSLFTNKKYILAPNRTQLVRVLRCYYISRS